MKAPTKKEYDTIEKDAGVSKMLILSISKIVPEEMWTPELKRFEHVTVSASSQEFLMFCNLCCCPYLVGSLLCVQSTIVLPSSAD